MEPMDIRAIMTGAVPWSAEECLDVMEWYKNLECTPKDDWDLFERGMLLQDSENGSVMKITLNPFKGMNQVGLYMAKRYKYGTMQNYMFRFMLILEFLSDYSEMLVCEGLVRRDEGGFDHVRYELIEALCILPYSRVEITDGEERHEFDYEEVLARAQELMEDS